MTLFKKSAALALALAFVGGAALAAEKCACCKDEKMTCCDEKKADEAKPAQPEHNH